MKNTSYTSSGVRYEHTTRIRNVHTIIENVCGNLSDMIYNCSDKSPHLFLRGARGKHEGRFWRAPFDPRLV